MVTGLQLRTFREAVAAWKAWDQIHIDGPEWFEALREATERTVECQEAFGIRMQPEACDRLDNAVWRWCRA